MQPSEREGAPPNDEILEIISGVAFNPFEKADGFYQKSDFLKDYKIPWDDACDLYLRRKFSFNNIEGYIDAISERADFQDKPHTNPYGDAKFDIEKGQDQEGNEYAIYHELPAILRLSFFLRSPRDFVSLNNTGISLLSEEARYILIHTYYQKSQDILHAIEDGKPYAIPERFFVENEAFLRTLRSIKDKDSEVTYNVSLLWFPPKVDDLKKIKLVFEKNNGRNDGGTRPEPIAPAPSGRELVTV